ncbi:hypothetical protein BC937DRAFT_92241 [Endogone sp. FLAS-F59071]|nr:hypothetical protein BC937DRAFT_92241 [Endogone sp. FLAS-F59071]|eukprot:RUS15607.1 hypothetical protein BC937DRAFT_92241 [Endogone sp. FLAS-F59071]
MLINATNTGPAALSTQSSHSNFIVSNTSLSTSAIPVSSLLTTPPTRRSSLTTPTTSNRRAASEWMVARPPPRHQCVECGVKVSPMWWDLLSLSNGLITEEKTKEEGVSGESLQHQQGNSANGVISKMSNGHVPAASHVQNGYANGQANGYMNGVKKEEGSSDVDKGSATELQRKLCQKCYWRLKANRGKIV